MRKRPMCLICLVFALGICLMRMIGVPLWGTPDLSDEMRILMQSECQVQIVGQIRNYEKKKNSAGYLLCGCEVRESKTTAFCERLYVIWQPSDLPIGSTVQVTGTLKAPETPKNPGQFDAAGYYETKGINCLADADTIKLLKRGRYNLREGLRKVREILGLQMETLLPEREAAILQTMLLGDSSALAEQVRTLYQQAGIAHILSVSGMHLSLLGMGIYRLCGHLWPGRKKAAALSAGCMVIYGIFTGCHTATFRAMIMFGVAMGARIIGRTYDALSALSLAAVLMLAERPCMLFSSGFLLSFGAVLGVVLVYPVLFPKTERRKTLSGRMRAAVEVYAAVTAAIAPLSAWYYYQIPLLGVLPNLLTGPTLAAVLIPGFTAGFLKFVNLQAAKALMLPVCGILKCYQIIAEGINRIPGSVWICGQPGITRMVGYYGILSVLLLVLHRNQNRKKEEEEKRHMHPFRNVCQAAVLAAAALILFWRPTSEFAVTVLDVGQGDCIEVRSGSFHFLIDGGSSSVTKVGTYRILPYLTQQGIQVLEGIVVTHPDEDHTNGILEILNAMGEGQTPVRAKRLFLPCWMKGGKDEIPLILAAQKAGIVVQYLQTGDRIQYQRLTIEVLHPTKNEYYREKTNAGSVVLRAEYEEFTALFTGDLEGQGEEELIKIAQPCDFLKVAHHGSANSTSSELLEILKPSISVFSCAWPGRYGHPHRELLERLLLSGSRIYGTPTCGAVFLWRKDGHTFLRGYLSSEEFEF
ncbi:MAG: DNA internalization-related competence protein ComEC/Rec2 [Fusicatenibacter sp.]|nr:DNA internalization-related competence protein ComEC/Rec2 [Fusicatenibacter sp.]